MSITVISLSNPINKLPQIIKNWNDVSEDLTNKILNECTDFRIKLQEILIYQERQIVYSCSYTKEYKNKDDEEGRIIITRIFDDNGCQFGDWKTGS